LGHREPTRTAWADATASFLAVCKRRADQGQIRQRTVKEYGRYLGVFPFARQAIGDVTPRQLIERLHTLDNRPGEKEHAFRVARTFFRWCVREHLIEQSPLLRMAPPPTGRPRERVLSEDELRVLWSHVRTPGSSFEALVAFLILTGCRRGEAAQLRWEWINQEQQTITFPGTITKNGRTHSIPYGDLTRDTLAHASRSCAHGVLAFPGRTAGIISGWGKLKARLDRDCQVVNWTLHDIRRTYATAMQRLGVRLEVTEQLLNHRASRAGVVGIYQQYGFEREMREAMLRFEKYVQELANAHQQGP